MHFSKTLSLSISLLLITNSVMAAPISKASTKKVSSIPAKAQVKKTSKAPLNPMVPYTITSETKPVLIPSALSNLLKKPIVSQPQDIDFLGSTPFDINRYSEGLSFPDSFTSADELLITLQNSPNLAIHMEALRQGFLELPPNQKKDLVVKLFKRYENAPEDPISYFDYGYAQLTYLNNQTGLFFLRKANDKLQNQFTALAYAMGQAQVDLNQEKGRPEEMTVRKLDVIHKLRDALNSDVQDHQPGFWPAYVQVIQKLADFPAYQGFTKYDFSLSYVPLGKKASFSQPDIATPAIQAPQDKNKAYALLVFASDRLKKKHKKGHSIPSERVDAEQQAITNEEPLIAIRSIPNSGHLLKFVKAGDDQVKVVVVDSQNQPLTSFLTEGGLDIVEDLDGNGVYELVIRQYWQTPLEPVRVYRRVENRYELDQELHDKFL